MCAAPSAQSLVAQGTNATAAPMPQHDINLSINWDEPAWHSLRQSVARLRTAVELEGKSIDKQQVRSKIACLNGCNE